MQCLKKEFAQSTKCIPPNAMQCAGQLKELLSLTDALIKHRSCFKRALKIGAEYLDNFVQLVQNHYTEEELKKIQAVNEAAEQVTG